MLVHPAQLSPASAYSVVQAVVFRGGSHTHLPTRTYNCTHTHYMHMDLKYDNTKEAILAAHIQLSEEGLQVFPPQILVSFLLQNP